LVREWRWFAHYFCSARSAPSLWASPRQPADSADFIKYLTANGVDVPTPELGKDFVNLGQAIRDHLDTGQDPNRTVDYLVGIGHTNANANMWLTGSVLYLCPRLNYLTHYPANG
jgi:hypothetical protein